MISMAEPRYCSNCRVELPEEATSCPACGVFAGDVFDGKLPRKKPQNLFLLITLLVLAAAGAAASWIYLHRPDIVQRYDPDPPPPRPTDTAPVRVVQDRPGGARRAAGAKISEPEAIRALRRHLTNAQGIAGQCIAVKSEGYRDGAYVLTAIDSCARTRLGRWRVDGRSGAVGR